MSKTLEEILRDSEDCKKPKGFREHVVYGWNRAKSKVKNGVRYVVEHPQEAAVYATLLTGAAAVAKKGFRSVDKLVTAHKERYNKERFVYDHSGRMYLKVKRALKSDDVRRINKLRSENPGMRMAEALERLDLLD